MFVGDNGEGSGETQRGDCSEASSRRKGIQRKSILQQTGCHSLQGDYLMWANLGEIFSRDFIISCSLSSNNFFPSTRILMLEKHTKRRLL